jgi:HSP20 family protein
MSKDDKKSLMFRPFLSFPYFDEDFWPQRDKEPSGVGVSEDEKNIYVEANLPGMTADDIEISYEKGMVLISGSKSEEEEDKKMKFYKKASSSFAYRVNIPGGVDETKQPEATYKDGVVKIIFQKSNVSSAKKITIKKNK